MSVLIVGGNGFVGLNIAEAVLGQGISVQVADLARPPPQALRLFAGIGPEFVDHAVDVTQHGLLAELVKRSRPAVLVYAAAITPNLQREARSGGLIVNVNVTALGHLLDALIHVPATRIVYVGSSAVFGRLAADDPPVADDHPHNPVSLYGITKSFAEAILRRWCEVHQRTAIVARLGWVFGRWEQDTAYRDMVSPIHQITAAAKKGATARIERDVRRDWLYGADAGEAIARVILGKGNGFAAFNVGPGHRWPLSKWCHLLDELYPDFRWEMGGPAPWNVSLSSESDDPPLDNRRFMSAYGQFQALGPDDAIKDYLSWLAIR